MERIKRFVKNKLKKIKTACNNFRNNLYRVLCKINFLGMGNQYLEKLLDRKLTHIVMDIGSVCNAKCLYCPRQEEGFEFKNNGLMSEEVFNTLYKQLKELPTVWYIALYAFGEPLLNKNAGEYIRLLSQLNNKYLVLSTNTTNMENFTEDLMLLNVLKFSIEGWDKETYEKSRVNLQFERTIERLKNFDKAVKERRKQGLKTPERVIHCLLTKNTNIDEFVKTWSPYADVIRFTILGGYPSWRENKCKPQYYIPPELEKECLDMTIKIKLSSCNYLTNTVSFNASGKVVLCCADFSQHLELGDYRDIKAAFNNKFRLKLCKDIYFGNPNICEACRNFYTYSQEDVEKYLPQLKNIKRFETNTFKIALP